MRRWTLRSASAGRPPTSGNRSCSASTCMRVFFRDGSGTHENTSQAAAKPALQVERPLEFLAAHQPAFEQTLPQRYPLGRHLRAGETASEDICKTFLYPTEPEEAR